MYIRIICVIFMLYHEVRLTKTDTKMVKVLVKVSCHFWPETRHKQKSATL